MLADMCSRSLCTITQSMPGARWHACTPLAPKQAAWAPARRCTEAGGPARAANGQGCAQGRGALGERGRGWRRGHPPRGARRGRRRGCQRRQRCHRGRQPGGALLWLKPSLNQLLRPNSKGDCSAHRQPCQSARPAQPCPHCTIGCLQERGARHTVIPRLAVQGLQHVQAPVWSHGSARADLQADVQERARARS
jgi:hypothetical protein